MTLQTLRFGAALAVMLGLAPLATAAPNLKVGREEPLFVGQTIDGKTLDLAALKGKVVIVNLWATWCPPCRAEMPAMDKVAKAYRNQGVEVIGLSLDHSSKLAEVKKVMAGFSYPAALIEDAKINRLGVITALPVTYIVAADGKVAYIFNADEGDLTEERLNKALAPLLKR